MADAEVTVGVRITWREERGDGSVCCACGDVAWLRHWRCVLRVGGSEEARQEEVLCVACAQVSLVKV